MMMMNPQYVLNDSYLTVNMSLFIQVFGFLHLRHPRIFRCLMSVNILEHGVVIWRSY